MKQHNDIIAIILEVVEVYLFLSVFSNIVEVLIKLNLDDSNWQLMEDILVSWRQLETVGDSWRSWS